MKQVGWFVFAVAFLYAILWLALPGEPEAPEMCSCAGMPDCSTHVFYVDREVGHSAYCALWDGGICCNEVKDGRFHAAKTSISLDLARGLAKNEVAYRKPVQDDAE